MHGNGLILTKSLIKVDIYQISLEAALYRCTVKK
jgi:hypothetical protein